MDDAVRVHVLQHHRQRHQSEVIRAIMLEDSLYLLHGLWVGR